MAGCFYGPREEGGTSSHDAPGGGGCSAARQCSQLTAITKGALQLRKTWSAAVGRANHRRPRRLRLGPRRRRRRRRAGGPAAVVEQQLVRAAPQTEAVFWPRRQ